MRLHLKPLSASCLLVLSSGLNADNNVAVDKLKNIASDKLNSTLEEGVGYFLDNAEISISGVESGKPTIGILGVQAISESEDLLDTVFGQYSLFTNDGRNTVNLGLGYRRMTEDEKWLFGVNAFYDHEFPYDHQRSSLGLEARSSVVEFNANKYWGLSGWVSGEAGVSEKALGGHDYEIGLALPYMPGSRFFYKKFQWNALNGAEDLKGSTNSININGEVLTPGLSLEIGRTNYDSREDTNFAKLTYNYSFGKQPKATPLFSEQAFAPLQSMKEKRLEKVRRQNLIVKQKDFTITLTGAN